MTKFITKCLLRHNGKRYECGSTIELKPDEAQYLSDLNAVERLEVVDVPTPEPTVPQNPVTTEKNDEHEHKTKAEGAEISNPDSEQDKAPALKAYAEMTGKEQISYLSEISEDEFLERYEEFLTDGKSKAKAYISRLMKSMDTVKDE